MCLCWQKRKAATLTKAASRKNSAVKSEGKHRSGSAAGPRKPIPSSPLVRIPLPDVLAQLPPMQVSYEAMIDAEVALQSAATDAVAAQSSSAQPRSVKEKWWSYARNAWKAVNAERK